MWMFQTELEEPANVCDPAQGYDYDQATKDNFGKIINKHGRRIVEFALKFYF
jgi:hypothetical protein